MSTILYARCSTLDQTLEHQRTQAEAAGFTFDHVLADHGISGVSSKLAERPEGRRLFDMLRAGDTLVVRWIDRLGRNYGDVTDSIREFMRRGVVIRTIINGMTFDGATTEPMQKAVRDALVAFMAAMGEAQAEASREAQRAGIAHARTNGSKRDRHRKAYLGRKPTYTPEQFAMVRNMLGQGAAVGSIAKATSLSRQTIYRIKGDPVGQGASLRAWFPQWTDGPA